MRIPVRGYEGLYEINENSEVFSLDRVVTFKNGSKRFIKARKLTASIRKGYLTYSLNKDLKARNFFAHRLAMLSFFYADGCESLQVNHIDGNKSNNKLENLEWCTASQNVRHAYDILKRPHVIKGKFGRDHPHATPIQGLIDGKVCMEFGGMMEAARAGYLLVKIRACIRGLLPSYKGMVWRYEKDAVQSQAKGE